MKFLFGCFLFFACPVFAQESTKAFIDLTHSSAGYLSLGIFIAAYVLVMLEERIELRKSKPMLLATGLIWLILGLVYSHAGKIDIAKEAIDHNLLEYAELMLFLLVAMTYISAMEERGLFDSLKCWILSKGCDLRQLFWITGSLAFLISPIADNLTTALLMCTVVLKIGGNNARFVNLACINIVIAANAGGAFSPFGDITTLMVWQSGMVDFGEFFSLFIPSVVNYLVPAFIMSRFVPKEQPEAVNEFIESKRGAKRIVVLFLLTILTAVGFHAALDFPPVIGMMVGLAYLQFFGYFLRKTFFHSIEKKRAFAIEHHDEVALKRLGSVVPFDVFRRISHAEWDTLLFFYGVVMCVGGLSLIGYLSMLSNVLYLQWDPIWANVFIGLLSALVDNIPVMYGVLNMQPDMSSGNWLLVTLTAGVGGSLLSLGSAAGVALMGQARGMYTFIGHLKWMPIILLGYVASILCHLLLNHAKF